MKKIMITILVLFISIVISLEVFAEAPTVPSSNITYTNYTNSKVRINWISGNGVKRIVVVKQGSAVDWVPSDSTVLSGVSANFASALDQGNGNKVVFNSNAEGISIIGLSPGQTYYVTIYDYNGQNSGTPTSNYLTTGVPVSNFTTLTPSVSVNPSSLSGFTADIGATSSEQTYVVSGNQVFGNVIITPPADYMVSLTSGGPYTSSVELTPVSYTVPNSTVYVVMTPGISGFIGGVISNRSAGAVTKNVSLSGIAYALPPSVAASDINFTNYTSTSVKISWTKGNGSRRIVVVKQGSAVDWLPTDNTSISGVNSVFTSASDQGGGNKIVYNSNGNSVNVSGLTSGLIYHVTIYEYHGVNTGSSPSAAYLTAGAPAANVTMLVPSVSADPLTLSEFSAILGSQSSEQFFTVAGDQVYADVVVTAPSNFLVSLNSGGPYTSSVNITPSNYSVPATTVYAIMTPTGDPGIKSGSTTIRSIGAPATVNVSVAGTAYIDPPTVAASGLLFSNVLSTNMVVSWTNGNGATRVVVMKQGSPVDWIPADNAVLSGANPNFTNAYDQGGGNKVVYNGSGSSLNVTGLTSGTTYYVKVYEYNGSNTNTPYTASYLATGAPSDFAVSSTPIITVNPTSLSGFVTHLGGSSLSQTYNVSATGLFKDLIISAPPNFQIATSSGGPFGSSIALTPLSGTISQTIIYVRMNPSSEGTFSANVSNASSGAITKNIAVSGKTFPAAYVWTGLTSLDWQVSTNWSPSRTSIASSDTLVFTSSPTGIITNVPSESIQRLSISGSASVILQSASAGNAISLNLPSSFGNALTIAEGSSLTLSGSNKLNLSIGAGSTGNVNGNINLTGEDHTLGTSGTWIFGSPSTVSYNGGAVQNVANLIFNNLSLSGSNTINLPSGTLVLAGNFTNNSTELNHNNGTVRFMGTSKTIGGTSVTYFNNISIGDNASVSLSSSQHLTGILTLGTGSTFTTTGHSFTLTSDASSTGRINVVPSGASIVGNITVQRYIPGSGGRYWYHLGSPVSGGTFVQLKTTATGVPPNPDNGIFITGKNIANTTEDLPSIGIANTGAASVYSFNTLTNAWTKPTDLASAIPAKTGYRFFVRDGDIDVAPSTGAKILSLTGSPNTGDQSFNLNYSAASAGWNFIANPYPSDITVDLSNPGWNTAAANLTDHTVYIWDADAGAYVTCLNGVPSSSGACTVPSFQSFWVVTGSGGGTLVATENLKVPGSSTIFKKAASYALPISILNLNSNASHGTLIRFDEEATSEFDLNLDALEKRDEPEFEQPFLSISTVEKNTYYSINTLPFEYDGAVSLKTIAPIGVNVLDFSKLALPGDMNAFLIDNYINQTIDLSSHPLYKFSVSEDNKTAENRFEVVFRKSENSNNGNAAMGKSEMIVYPNPTKGAYVNVMLNNISFEEADIICYDAFGREVFRQRTNSYNNVVNMSKVSAPGIYMIMCNTGKESFVEKVVIE